MSGRKQPPVSRGGTRTDKMKDTKDINQRIEHYWTLRAHDFGVVRHNELHSELSERWMSKMKEYLPEGTLDILDAGTGTGYFAILLSMEGHRVTGIDLTESMLEEAKDLAPRHGAGSAIFLKADATETGFEDQCFDAIVTRNLTWTLPDPAKAYKEWHRILRPGGILLNFDANYADNVRHQNQEASYIEDKDVYGHIGITPDMKEENAEITLAVPASRHRRPAWDASLAEKAGFSEWGAEERAGKEILKEKDLEDAPLFLFWAKK